MTAQQKFVAAALLFLAWGAVVGAGLCPATDFVEGIKQALFGLGVFTAAMSNPKE